jgi:alkyl hydroperoxide reductase subunit AhpC
VELQNHYEDFQSAGVEVVALVVASPSSVEAAQEHIGVYYYPVLADPDHQVSEDYGVYNLLGDSLAAPAVFIIDGTGQIVWYYVGANSRDRLSAETILDHLP